MNGILNLYKPQGITSHTAVSKIRRLYGVKRVGHAGTLDPMASGVLPVLIGNAASVQNLIMGHDKSYRAGVLFGTVTDTGDITGKVISRCEPDFSAPELDDVLKKFVGEQKQVPPMYSAIKQNGVKLYDLARNGIEVERKARDITIYSITTEKPYADSRCVIDVACSKGTYIRSLAEDIGKALGCGACLFSLERTRCGVYTSERSYTLEVLEEMSARGDTEALEAALDSPEELFSGLAKVVLPDFYKRLALNGAEIYLKKAKIPEALFEKEISCRLYGADGVFFAVACLGEYPEGKAVKIKYRFL